MGGFTNPIVAGITLLIEAIQSPNFVSGSSGWRIGKDGSAEFNSATLRGTLVFPNENAILFYSTNPPSHGSLQLSISPVAGTDAYGNNYVQGFATYYADQRVAMSVGFPSTGGQAFGLAADSANATPAQIILGTNWQNALQPFMEAFNDGGSIVDRFVANVSTRGWISDTISAFAPSSGNAETWHAPSSLGSGWATGSHTAGFQAVRYRLLTNNEVEINGLVNSTSATPAAVIWTMGSGYVPASLQRVNVTVNAGGGSIVANGVDIHTDGTVQLEKNLTASAQDVQFSVTYPLD